MWAYQGQRGEGYFSPDMARGVEGGPPSNGPPMPDCGKKCNQCECVPLQTSHVRKHVKADRIARHSSQLPDSGLKKCNQCNVSVQTSHLSRPTKETLSCTGHNVLFAFPKTTQRPLQNQRRVMTNPNSRTLKPLGMYQVHRK